MRRCKDHLLEYTHLVEDTILNENILLCPKCVTLFRGDGVQKIGDYTNQQICKGKKCQEAISELSSELTEIENSGEELIDSIKAIVKEWLSPLNTEMQICHTLNKNIAEHSVQLSENLQSIEKITESQDYDSLQSLKEQIEIIDQLTSCSIIDRSLYLNDFNRLISKHLNSNILSDKVNTALQSFSSKLNTHTKTIEPISQVLQLKSVNIPLVSAPSDDKELTIDEIVQSIEDNDRDNELISSHTIDNGDKLTIMDIKLGSETNQEDMMGPILKVIRKREFNKITIKNITCPETIIDRIIMEIAANNYKTVKLRSLTIASIKKWYQLIMDGKIIKFGVKECKFVKEQWHDIFNIISINNTNLKEIGFINCNLTDDCIEELIKSLLKNNTLECLNISHNSISLSAYQRLEQSVSNSQSLNEIILRGNPCCSMEKAN